MRSRLAINGTSMRKGPAAGDICRRGESPCETVEAPDFLKGKLVKGRGIDPEEAQRRARAAIAAMQEEYLRQAYKDLGEADRAVARARSATETALGDALQDVLWIAHEMRGQAGTFDYPLVTAIGTLLCRYIEESAQPESVDLDALAIHVDSMRAVIVGRLTGDGGPIGEKLLSGMQARIERLGGDPAARTGGPDRQAGLR